MTSRSQAALARCGSPGTSDLEATSGHRTFSTGWALFLLGMIGMMVSVLIGGIGADLVPHADYAAVVRLTVFAAIAFVSLVLVGVAFVSMGAPHASPPPLARTRRTGHRTRG